MSWTGTERSPDWSSEAAMTMNQALMQAFESLRALCSARLPRAHEPAVPASASRGPREAHHFRTKQELRQALQQLKALRHARGHQGNEKPKQAA
jgi:hypothetical protein